MKKNRKIRFRLLYIINAFIKIILYRKRNGDWPVGEITIDELFERLNSNGQLVLIDVRMAKYFNSGYGHLKNAKSYPIMKMLKKLNQLDTFKEDEVVTMCYGGGLSLVAADVLAQRGFKDVKSLHGGTDLWVNNKYPTTIS